jgi:hypothetical protein
VDQRSGGDESATLSVADRTRARVETAK